MLQNVLAASCGRDFAPVEKQNLGCEEPSVDQTRSTEKSEKTGVYRPLHPAPLTYLTGMDVEARSEQTAELGAAAAPEAERQKLVAWTY